MHEPCVVIPRHRGMSIWSNFCKHYRAMAEHDTCLQGHSYADFKNTHAPIAYRYYGRKTIYKSSVSYPCFLNENVADVSCQDCQIPNDEEVAAHDREMEK